MQSINRKALTRISALILVVMLVFSFTASFAAASFTSSKAGIKYGGKTFKLGKSYTTATMKKYIKNAFGSYKRKTSDPCTEGSYFEYVTNKGVTIETLQKNGSKKEKIITITVKSKSVPTVSGLKVGNKVSKIADLYGKKCSKWGSTLLYTSGKYNVYFYTKSKKVTKIQFWLE